MSKRTMILLAVAFICVIAAFFLQKHELSESEPEPEEIESEEVETEEKQSTDGVIQKEATTTGTDKTE